MTDTQANETSRFTGLTNDFEQEAKKIPYLELYIFQKVKFFSIHPEVLEDLGVVHEVGVMLWDGVVAETHHFLRGVDDHGLVDAGPSFFRGFLWQIRCFYGNLRLNLMVYKQPRAR